MELEDVKKDIKFYEDGMSHYLKRIQGEENLAKLSFYYYKLGFLEGRYSSLKDFEKHLISETKIKL